MDFFFEFLVTTFMTWLIITSVILICVSACYVIKEERKQKRREEIEDVCIELLARSLPDIRKRYSK